MGLEPVTVTLSSFERLEILRGEFKARAAELQETEKELRGALRELATHQYLKSVSPSYARRPVPQGAATVSELEERRRALHEILRAIGAAMPELERATGTGRPGRSPSRYCPGGTSRPAPKQARRSRFE